MEHPSVQKLAADIYAQLQVYWPIIAVKAAEKTGEALPSAISKLWTKIRERFSQKPSAEEALEDLLKSPDDTDSQAAFRIQLKKLLEEDLEFSQIIRDMLETSLESPTSNVFQSGTGNISVQGDNNQVTHNQNFHVNNINLAPKPRFEMQGIDANIPENGKFISHLRVSVIAPYPVENLSIKVDAPSIEGMEISPMRAGLMITGHSGCREGFCFTNVPNASGDYILTIISSNPETFTVYHDIR